MSDSDFDSAWRAFADADARVRAPDRIRDAVIAEWDGPRAVSGAVRPRHRSVARATLTVAATLTMTVALFQLREARGPVRESAAPASRSAVPGSAARVEGPARAPRFVDSGRRVTPLPVRRRAQVAHGVMPAETSSTGGSAALVALTGEPALAAEPLQLVRLRVPRTSLRAFGVALIDPDASGLVDVDLIVGSDGLPRDIRRVRPVVDVRADQSMESP